MKKLKRATKHIKRAARRLKKAHKIKQINWTALLKHRDKTKGIGPYCRPEQQLQWIR